MEEIEKWKSVLDRYAKISSVVFDLKIALKSHPNDLEIQTCVFCRESHHEECFDCEWAENFGCCNEDGSRWMKIYDKFNELEGLLDKMVRDIKEVLDEKTNRNGVSEGDKKDIQV